MDLQEQIKSIPIQPEKSERGGTFGNVTSCKAGRIVPLYVKRLHREDRVAGARMQINLRMMETSMKLENAVNVTAYAHFIPDLAFERFNGMDALNRSYSKEPETEGGNDVIPYFETVNYSASAAFWNTLGVHWVEGAPMNSGYLEAYNTLVNWRRKARSTKLPVRLKSDTTLASGFWKNTYMRHIVPDFDQAMIDGEVSLNIASAQLPVKSVDRYQVNASPQHWAPSHKNTEPPVDADGHYDYAGKIWAELEENGVTVSLSNIELAKKTAAFAAMRKAYAGLDDDYIIDLLMQGIRVPNEQLSQPILLDRQSTIFGYDTRYATDSGNLDKSVTRGLTSLNLTMRTPPMNTGGYIMVTVEIVPEQLFERQKDHFLGITDPAKLPNFTRDFLDPEKVAVVKNDHVDVQHSTPDGVFGYTFLNHEWDGELPRIGGKFFRALGDGPSEDRQRIWSSETVDPALTEDFYLVNDLHHEVFASPTEDAFEISSRGAISIVGNTVFGKRLEEDTGDYQAIADQVDDTRVDQT